MDEQSIINKFTEAQPEFFTKFMSLVKKYNIRLKFKKLEIIVNTNNDFALLIDGTISPIGMTVQEYEINFKG